MALTLQTVIWDGSTTGKVSVYGNYYKVADLPTNLINEDYFIEGENITYDERTSETDPWTEETHAIIRKVISEDLVNIYRVGAEESTITGILIAKDNAKWNDTDVERGIYFYKSELYVNKKLEYYTGIDYTYEKEVTWDGDTTGKESIVAGPRTLYKIITDDYYTKYNMAIDSLLRRTRVMTTDQSGTITENEDVIRRTDLADSTILTNAIGTAYADIIFAADNATLTIEEQTYNLSKGVWVTCTGDESLKMYISKIKFGTNEGDIKTVMSVKFAVKPKYATRRAIEDPLYKEDNFVDIIECATVIKAKTLMDTAWLAIFYNDAFYPVDMDTVEAQMALVKAGSAPTVSADAYFGYLKLEQFVSVVDLTLAANAEYKKIQSDVEIYNGIMRGNSIYVSDPTGVSITAVDKVGHYIAFNVDTTKAAAGPAAKYTSIKLYLAEGASQTGITATNGINTMFVDADATKCIAKGIVVKATGEFKTSASATAVTESVEFAFDSHLNYITIENINIPSEIGEHKDVDPTYAITYNMAGGAWGSKAGKTSYGADDLPYTPPVPVLSGARFLKWTPANIGEGSVAAVQFVATFDKDAITYDLDGGSWAEGADVKYSYDESDLPYTPPTPVKEGYTFNAWTPASIESGSTGAKSFVASWNQDEE